MNATQLLQLCIVGLLCLSSALAHGATTATPSIILIYADDLGYGDVGCYGAKRIKTPNLDRLAAEGLRFTDAHATSGTCTPSRYALMTGEYPWRKKGTGVLPGDASLIIEPGRTTLPSMLQKAGYLTGMVGKWHLGLGGTDKADWNGEVTPGPNEVGFDYNFIMAATGDRVPTVFIEDHRVVNLDKADPIAVDYAKKIGTWPTGKENPELLKMHPSHGHDMTIVNGISRIGFMTGGKAALWKDEDMSDVFTKKAVEFIEKSSGQPFFLYLAAHEPHVPRVPHPRFVGKTELGPRGDAIAQLDWSVGQVLAALDRQKIAEKTLVIFSSDNGPVVDDGYKDDAVKKLGDHKPAGLLRGGKYSSFEGGTRVPFIVRWPDRVKPGVSDALVCQIDLLASLASLTGQKLAQDDAPDSFDLLPVLLGEARNGRDQLVEQGGGIGFRLGQWKYIEPASGPKIHVNTNTETGRDAADQLYDLASDLGEKNNVAEKNPDKVAAMRQRLKAIRDAGRSRP